MTYAAQIQVDGMWFQVATCKSFDDAHRIAWQSCWDLLASSHRVVDEDDSIVYGASL